MAINIRKTQETMSRMERYKAELLENMPWGYALIDSSGHIVDVSATGHSLTGMTREQFLSLDVRDYYHKVILPKLRNGEKDIHMEYAFPVEGGCRELSFNIRPMVLETGEHGAIVWFSDVT